MQARFRLDAGDARNGDDGVSISSGADNSALIPLNRSGYSGPADRRCAHGPVAATDICRAPHDLHGEPVLADG